MHNINPVIKKTHGGICQLQPSQGRNLEFGCFMRRSLGHLGVEWKTILLPRKTVDDSGGHYIDDMYEYIYIQIHIVYSIYIYVCGGIKQTATILGKTWRDVLFLQFLCLGLVIELAPDNGWLGEDPFLSGPDLFGRVETQSKKAA